MKRMLWPLAVIMVPAILAGAGLLLIRSAPRAPAAADQAATLGPTASPSPTVSHTASASPRATATPRRRRHHYGPWAVVSTYYRYVGSHRYGRAWALIGPAMAADQTYQQFVAGYSCTGTEKPTKTSQSGHQVSFNLTVVNNCTGAAQNYTGTDTVRRGKIVVAIVTPTG